MNIQALLTVPREILLKTVKSKCELATILQIGLNAVGIDYVYHLLLKTSIDKSLVQSTIQKVYSSSMSDLEISSTEGIIRGSLPLLFNIQRIIDARYTKLLGLLEKNLDELKSHRQSCLQFAELNRNTYEELKKIGANDLAYEKSLVTDIEKELALRIESLLNGKYAPFSSWGDYLDKWSYGESIISKKRSRSTEHINCDREMETCKRTKVLTDTPHIAIDNREPLSSQPFDISVLNNAEAETSTISEEILTTPIGKQLLKQQTPHNTWITQRPLPLLSSQEYPTSPDQLSVKNRASDSDTDHLDVLNSSNSFNKENSFLHGLKCAMRQSATSDSPVKIIGDSQGGETGESSLGSSTERLLQYLANDNRSNIASVRNSNEDKDEMDVKDLIHTSQNSRSSSQCKEQEIASL
ncbi:hypothetical protein BC833DRAFT_579961 [Globomyces pollinis-pini]|nr:hypothetical protein BC833DRAFT_579961 [Globomyces pollinis-pini]